MGNRLKVKQRGEERIITFYDIDKAKIIFQFILPLIGFILSYQTMVEMFGTKITHLIAVLLIITLLSIWNKNIIKLIKPSKLNYTHHNFIIPIRKEIHYTNFKAVPYEVISGTRYFIKFAGQSPAAKEIKLKIKPTEGFSFEEITLLTYEFGINRNQ